MPSHTPAEAFIKLWCENEIPWRWPVWQSLTGINHGLFPTDGNPPPSDWNTVDARDIRSYFDQYIAKGSEDAKKQFATQRKGGEVVPGRAKWRRWIGDRWREWGLHATIVACLSEERIHPLTMLRGGSTDKWPPGDMWIPIVIDNVALKLFGSDAMDQTGEHALPAIRSSVQIFVQKVWDTLRRQYSRTRKDLDRRKSNAKEAFSDLDKPPITKAKIQKAMHLLNRWKLLAELFGVQDHLEEVARMMATITDLLDAMGQKVAEPAADSPSKGLSKPTKDMLSQLASEEDVADLVRLYDDLFSADPDEINAFAAHAEIDPTLCDLSRDGDLGVDIEVTMDEVRLNHELGFTDSRPFQFASLRHHLGLNGWDHPGLLETLKSTHPDAVSPIRLHWHQLVAVHAIIRGLFSAEPRATSCLGMLIADEVGLGKTAIALSIIGFLNHIIWLRNSDLPLPPILQKYSHRGTDKIIPGRPHIVVVPVTIVGQWEQEFKTFFLPKGMDILVYPGSKLQQEEFWGESGPLAKSKHDKQQVIILATQAALQSDFLYCYAGANKSKDRKPWDLPKARRTDLSKTMFGQKYLTVTIDEIHQMRNIGVKYFAALRLREQGEIILGLTATPLQTAPKDILAIGRIIGIPEFLEDRSAEDEKDDMRASRRAKRNMVVAKAESEEEQKEALNNLRLIHLSSIARMHKSFAGHIIRRTPDSKDYWGKCLLELPPCVVIHAILKLTDREMGVILTLAEVNQDSISTANGLNEFTTKRFYLEYRMALGFAREDPNSVIPTFKTLEEWIPVKSTKIDVCAKLCKYLLSRDDAPPVTFHDGEAFFPELPSTPCTKTRRILIYQEFPSLGPLLRRILSLYGIECCYMDGKMRPARRREMVEKFHMPNGPRVLIFSSVGTAGLNLSVADTIILLDQPWSAQDEHQIRGRAHRQPQKKIVHMYRLLADKTTDILLSGMAQGKSELLEAFLNQKAGQSALSSSDYITFSHLLIRFGPAPLRECA
ncbi:P-loop containing nucleoside triphosphate hydrolase protein [Infundibulicybe gibba]|nr:P-loop containing nucleoside triphosphate hydrolase protein [Infundibulicybe gibba]